MPFNIENFKSQGLIDGGVRPTLFTVTLTFPTIVGQVSQGGNFLINAATLPPSIIDEIRVPYFGRAIKLAGDRTFQDWTINVLMDEDYQLRNAFEAWHNAMNYLISNVMDPSVAGDIADNSTQTYKTDLMVSNYAKAGPPSESGIIRDYKIVGAFPTSIGPVRMGWGEVNRVAEFEVTLAYDYWVPGPNGTTNGSWSPEAVTDSLQ